MTRTRLRLLPLFSGTLIGSALSFSFAHAAQDDTRPLADLPLEQLMQVQTVTSASRFEQTLSDAPSTVSVLTAQDIREYGWRTLADALAALPGLYVSSDRNYSYLGARGFLRPGDYDSRFLLLIDGMRSNDNVYDQAAIGTEGMLDMDLVERIEYVPGPGAAVYGSNALFGVINVITRSGSALDGMRAAQSFGSQGERSSRLSYGGHAQDGSDILLSATSYARRGGDLYFPEFDNGSGGGGMARGLDWDRAHKLFAKLHRGGLTFSAGYVARTKGIPTASFGAVFGAPDSTRDTQAFANLAYEADLGQDLRLSARLSWGRADYLGVGIYPGDDGGAYVNVDGDHGAWSGAGASVLYRGLRDHRIVFGAELQRDRRRDQFNYDVGSAVTWLDDHRSGSRRAAFVEDEWHIGGATILNAGLRHDRDSTAGARFSPRLALVRTVSPKDTLKAIYGTAFRTPNAYEKYYTIPSTGGQEANPALQREDIRTQELVWEHRPDVYGKLSLSLFRYRMHNLITQVEDPATGLLKFTNTERANARGMEAAADRSFRNGARLHASYSWQQATDGLGQALVNSPRQLFKAGASLPWPALRARAAGEWQCTSLRLTEHAQAGGGCIANLVLSSARRIDGWDWSIGLHNAFDRVYADPAGPAFVQEAIAREGRTLTGKLEYGF